MKDIEGYEGLYAITSCGKVWSYRTKKFLKPVLSKGYYKVNLSKNGKTENGYIHRLVANAYLEKVADVVNHKDENPLNNCVNNLEWCSIKENNNYGTRNERSIETNQKTQGTIIRCIETNTIYNSYKEAVEKTGLTDYSIKKACKNSNYIAGECHWEIIKKQHEQADSKPIICVETGKVYESAS